MLVGVGVLIAVVVHVGSGPFVQGLLSIDLRVIAATFVLSAAATLAAAWRWSIIAGRLGVGLRFTEAVGMYYRSQFLNTVLPGGVVGDVQRAVTQGRNAGNVAQAARAVVIERTMGQVVQIALAVIVVAWFGLEFEGYLLPALGIGLAVLAVAVLATAAASVRARCALRRELDELSAGVGSPGALRAGRGRLDRGGGLPRRDLRRRGRRGRSVACRRSALPPSRSSSCSPDPSR